MNRFSRYTRKEKGKSRHEDPVPTTSKSVPGDTVLGLSCLVEGDRSVFRVTVPINSEILELKELVKEKGVDIPFAKDLVLLKVSHILESG